MNTTNRIQWPILKKCNMFVISDKNINFANEIIKKKIQ